ncbi:glycoside hydrolase family 2 protein [Jiangella rhizosphaerae]|uniref:beta-mannosidase n=1 Tax=Jiangella rhizosphaerae TaxID=2293569 RepID=A0A418KKV2_9ACTN|nr:glycoside hydrolase family 2 protein [Jiangella rhizosphaerae]RIQ17874.1 glycoside hydrolase family 2 protein [Jiangella rhizosphaerae]
MTTTDLTSSDWTVRALRGPVPDEFAAVFDGVPATVPGVVHTDLLAAGVIPDPFDGDNEARLSWIGETDWEYRTEFEWADDGEERVDLAADGLDTVATVLLNDHELGHTANQHRRHRFDARGALREGRNELRVVFAAPVPYARRMSERLGPRPHANVHPYNAIRKTAANFGWDWGPDVATAGIWQGLRLESWSGARLASVRPETRVAGGYGLLTVVAEIEWGTRRVAPVLRAEVAGVAAELSLTRPVREARLELVVPEVRLWQPRGRGEQHRYPVTVRLDGGSGAWRRAIGFRTVEVDTTPDEAGTPFVLRVNGADVYVRGANWIPADPFLPRVTRERLAASLRDAVDAGLNLIRVWGGGAYESEDFYDLCDELGLLVWQDFLLACAAYSEDEPLRGEFEAEAREAITRLAAHPSLVVWNGGNENLWGYADWGWRSRLGGLSWGEGYYTELFPRLVAELAPGTPYADGSPYSVTPYRHPNDDAHGTMHIWDVWNTRDYVHYRDYRPRFVSEFGFQGPPAWSTLRAVVHDDPLDPYGPQLLTHQKANDGNGKLERGLGEHLPPPETFEDWHWATQLNQARAIRCGIAHFRSLVPHNSGWILWQLNDCWPVISWAVVDSHGVRKPVWFALREAAADRFVSVQPGDGGAPLLAVHNDRPEPWSAGLTVRRITVHGDELGRWEGTLGLQPRAATTVPLDDVRLALTDPATQLLVADLSTGERALYYGAEDPRLALEPRPFTATARRADGGYVVDVAATSLVKDVTLLADKVDPAAVVDTGLVTLLAGERCSIRVTSAADLDPAALTGPGVLRTANDLVRPAGGPGPRR